MGTHAWPRAIMPSVAIWKRAQLAEYMPKVPLGGSPSRATPEASCSTCSCVSRYVIHTNAPALPLASVVRHPKQ